MSKIKKQIIIVGFLLLNIKSFSFQINELKFGEKIKVGTSKTKEFIITNNTNISKIYKLEVEKKKNIKIFPNVFTLNPLSKRYFKIKVNANEPKGKYDYFLVIKEMNKDSSINSLDLNKTIRIKQNYIVE